MPPRSPKLAQSPVTRPTTVRTQRSLRAFDADDRALGEPAQVVALAGQRAVQEHRGDELVDPRARAVVLGQRAGRDGDLRAVLRAVRLGRVHRARLRRGLGHGRAPDRYLRAGTDRLRVDLDLPR